MLTGRRLPASASVALSLALWLLCAGVFASSTAYAYDGQVHSYDVASSSAADVVHPIGESLDSIASTAVVSAHIYDSSGYRYATNTARPFEFSRTESLSGNAASRDVAEIAESMRTGGWQGPPIKVVDVDGRLYVVDGHHRLAAARQVGLDVPYDVVDPATVIGLGQWTSIDDIMRDAATVGPDRLR